MNGLPSPTFNLAPFDGWTLRNETAQCRLTLR